jgi:hypothetical protein
MHERSVLHALDFSSISVRPLHPQSDFEAQKAFKKTSPSWHAPRSRRSLPASRLNLVSDAMKADSLHYEAVRIRCSGASSHAEAIDYRH